VNNSPVCVDASFLIRLVVDAEDQLVATRWWTWSDEKRHVIAPTLLLYEVVNALHQYYKHGYLSETTVQTHLETVCSLSIVLHADADLHVQALMLARQYALPATYDAHYVALAERMGAQLWTLDQRLYRSVGHLPWVHTIEPD